MIPRYCVVAALLLSVPWDATGEEPKTVVGRVVDEAGRPVEGADISAFWGANGKAWEQVVDLRAKDPEALWRDEGRMEPWGDTRARSDADGRFSIPAQERRNWLMILDRDRKRGALIDPRTFAGPVEARLQPLVRVSGTTRLEGKEGPMPWSCTYFEIPYNEADPLENGRVAICGSLRSRFSFLVPPGTYQVSASGSDPNSSTVDGPKIAVAAGSGDIDLGALVLRPVTSLGINDLIDRSRARGTWGNYREIVGKTPPDWHLTDARGIAKDARLADFRGRWVVLYFWSPGCAPCLAKDLPELMAFHKAHAGQRERFEILAFCTDFDEKLKTVAELEAKLEPVRKAVWGGHSLPFPVLLDSTFQTYERFGLEGDDVPNYLLINPDGKLVEGGLDALARTLDGPGR
ncbi:redoxin domain-containing protein [Tundrisphaera sp. TA3]|uniref:redoxin domain-containing protein n=1 Tax=Tundrisphaera sp. TA3 TaxID=3435775 RepID=UPI003EBD23EF